MSGITPDLPAFAAEIPNVLEKLEATRREFKGFRIWLWLASVLLWEFALASGLILADWMWVLPASVRGLGLMAMAGLVVVPLFRARRRFERHKQAASEVESHFPELESAGPHGGRVCRAGRRSTFLPRRACSRHWVATPIVEPPGLTFGSSSPGPDSSAARSPCSSPRLSESLPSLRALVSERPP